MPIQGLEQPEIIAIEDTLRLRKFDGKYDFALKWYQNEDMVYMVDGVRRAYDMDRLTRMYTYLNQAGELYFIEVLENGSFRPIGDVTFWQDDMPIVIGDPHYRGKGIAEKFCPHWFGAAERWGMTMYPLVKSTTGMSRPAAAAKASGFAPTKRPGKGSNTESFFESERTGKGYSDLF